MQGKRFGNMTGHGNEGRRDPNRRTRKRLGDNQRGSMKIRKRTRLGAKVKGDMQIQNITNFGDKDGRDTNINKEYEILRQRKKRHETKNRTRLGDKEKYKTKKTDEIRRQR